jgi:predicted amidophosphoribosyltransferase
MTKISPRQIKGAWTEGYALDVQTVSSTFVGYNEGGHPQFDTTRSELGELLFKLKYRGDQSVVAPIAEAVATYLTQWKPGPEIIVPVPATTVRKHPPVVLIADAVAKLGKISCIDCVKTTRNPAKSLKNVFDPVERQALLADLYTVDPALTKGKKILLLDDLYRSGATMNAVTQTLLGKGEAANVVVLAITCTRSHA